MLSTTQQTLVCQPALVASTYSGSAHPGAPQQGHRYQFILPIPRTVQAVQRIEPVMQAHVYPVPSEHELWLERPFRVPVSKYLKHGNMRCAINAGVPTILRAYARRLDAEGVTELLVREEQTEGLILPCNQDSMHLYFNYTQQHWGAPWRIVGLSAQDLMEVHQLNWYGSRVGYGLQLTADLGPACLGPVEFLLVPPCCPSVLELVRVINHAFQVRLTIKQQNDPCTSPTQAAFLVQGTEPLSGPMLALLQSSDAPSSHEVVGSVAASPAYHVVRCSSAADYELALQVPEGVNPPMATYTVHDPYTVASEPCLTPTASLASLEPHRLYQVEMPGTTQPWRVISGEVCLQEASAAAPAGFAPEGRRVVTRLRADGHVESTVVCDPQPLCHWEVQHSTTGAASVQGVVTVRCSLADRASVTLAPGAWQKGSVFCCNLSGCLQYGVLVHVDAERRQVDVLVAEPPTPAAVSTTLPSALTCIEDCWAVTVPNLSVAQLLGETERQFLWHRRTKVSPRAVPLQAEPLVYLTVVYRASSGDQVRHTALNACSPMSNPALHTHALPALELLAAAPDCLFEIEVTAEAGCRSTLERTLGQLARFVLHIQEDATRAPSGRSARVCR